jgi:hypothetical protein
MYLNRNGQLRKLNYWGKVGDRVRGFFHTLGRFRIDWLSDHLINAYIDAIVSVCERAEAAGYKDEVPLAKFWRRSHRAAGTSHVAGGSPDRLTRSELGNP